MSTSLVQTESPYAPHALDAIAVLFSEAITPATSPGDDPVPAGKFDSRLDLPLDELSFYRLCNVEEIARIQHLRGEIQLPAAALADPSFHTREKKETSTGL